MRQAAQELTIGLRVMVFGAVVAASALPDGWNHALINAARGLGAEATLFIAGVALAVVDGCCWRSPPCAFAAPACSWTEPPQTR